MFARSACAGTTNFWGFLPNCASCIRLSCTTSRALDWIFRTRRRTSRSNFPSQPYKVSAPSRASNPPSSTLLSCRCKIKRSASLQGVSTRRCFFDSNKPSRSLHILIQAWLPSEPSLFPTIAVTTWPDHKKQNTQNTTQKLQLYTSNLHASSQLRKIKTPNQLHQHSILTNKKKKLFLTSP